MAVRTMATGRYPDGAIRALFGSLALTIRRHLAVMGAPTEPNYAIAQRWSVAPLNSGGFHFKHVHFPRGISSAFYRPHAQGLQWLGRVLKFGEPGSADMPHVPQEHLVGETRTGASVLVPVLYMWHGTVDVSVREGKDCPRLRHCTAVDAVAR